MGGEIEEMKKQQISVLIAIVSLLVLFVPGAAARPNHDREGSSGAVYIMTNDPSGNSVLVFSRAADGTLTWTGTFATNGLGATGLTGSNQGGLAISGEGKTLLVVNAGSNDVSVFHINHDGLVLTDKTGSGGAFPISVTIHEKTQQGRSWWSLRNQRVLSTPTLLTLGESRQDQRCTHPTAPHRSDSHSTGEGSSSSAKQLADLQARVQSRPTVSRAKVMSPLLVAPSQTLNRQLAG